VYKANAYTKLDQQGKDEVDDIIIEKYNEESIKLCDLDASSLRCALIIAHAETSFSVKLLSHICGKLEPQKLIVEMDVQPFESLSGAFSRMVRANQAKNLDYENREIVDNYIIDQCEDVVQQMPILGGIRFLEFVLEMRFDNPLSAYLSDYFLTKLDGLRKDKPVELPKNELVSSVVQIPRKVRPPPAGKNFAYYENLPWETVKDLARKHGLWNKVQEENSKENLSSKLFYFFEKKVRPCYAADYGPTPKHKHINMAFYLEIVDCIEKMNSDDFIQLIQKFLSDVDQPYLTVEAQTQSLSEFFRLFRIKLDTFDAEFQHALVNCLCYVAPTLNKEHAALFFKTMAEIKDVLPPLDKSLD
jgi:hypothetical protein